MKIIAFFGIAMRDIAGLAAVGSISYGAWLIYPPYGFITGGCLVLFGTIIGTVLNRRSAG